ncbi:MAG: RDD family protein [Acidobacteria bacterium]|nr:RDD family protein [Acidobacteriota bacterium]
MAAVEQMPLTTKASLGRRFAARFIDALVMLVPVVVVTNAIGRGFNIGTTNTGTDQFVATALGVLLTYGYFVVLEARQGHTIGKRLLGMTVRGPEGLPTLEQSARRNVFMFLAILPGPIGGVVALATYASIAVSVARDPQGRGRHDQFAGTTVSMT